MRQTEQEQQTEKIIQITQEIMRAPENRNFTERGEAPLFSAPPSARILLVGQAPGLKAMQSQKFWNDQSGKRLRAWMGVDEKIFYESGLCAVLPMDFYYPGRGKSGDLPPRKDFASKWHERILEALPELRLTLLIGAYAQAYYLGERKKATLTETVAAYREYLPQIIPLVHPSPRNGIWLRQHPWFEEELLPVLKEKVGAQLCV